MVISHLIVLARSACMVCLHGLLARLLCSVCSSVSSAVHLYLRSISDHLQSSWALSIPPEHHPSLPSILSEHYLSLSGTIHSFRAPLRRPFLSRAPSLYLSSTGSISPVHATPTISSNHCQFLSHTIPIPPFIHLQSSRALNRPFISCILARCTCHSWLVRVCHGSSCHVQIVSCSAPVFILTTTIDKCLLPVFMVSLSSCVFCRLFSLSALLFFFSSLAACFVFPFSSLPSCFTTLFP